MTNHLRFRVETIHNSAGSLVPEVDGTSLVTLVGGYESARGYEPAGGYGGLVPEHFDFGDLSLFYLGSGARQWPQPGEAWLLGCDCGEVACWPLGARITVDGAKVRWSAFEQPHRPEWDYSAFGPFVFARQQYEKAIQNGLARLKEATEPYS